jgi:hypothetical protein
MKTRDLRDFELQHVRAQDILATGAPLDSVNLFLAIKVDRFIEATGLPFTFLKNGLTTGIHRASWHPRGLAVDGAFSIDQGLVKIYDVWKVAIECGFHGIGLYWNGKAYSVHMDLRPRLSFWGGTKVTKVVNGAEVREWEYFSVFQDPREYKAAA